MIRSAFAALLISIGAIEGCANNSGGGGGSGTTSTAAQGASSSSGKSDCGDIGFDQAACGACATTSCCAEVEACKSGTACGTFRTCVDACAKGDPACLTHCQTKYGNGQAPLMAMQQCLGEKCAMQCGGGGLDEVCDSTISYGNAQCAECLTDNCCIEYTVCAQTDPDACARCVNGDGPCDASGNAAIACHAKCKVECGGDF